MKRNRYLISLGIVTTLLVACSDQEQTAKEVTHQKELEKTEQVQGIVNDKAAVDRQNTEKETGENTKPAEGKKPE